MTTPKVFNTKNKINFYKNSKTEKDKIVTGFNYMPVHKHFPPYIREWVNGIYCYNYNNIKLLPNYNTVAYSFARSFFFSYDMNINLSKKKKSKIWRRKNSNLKKLNAGEPYMKHTNDKVDITIYTYGRNTTSHTRKIIPSIFIMNEYYKSLKMNYYLLKRKLKSNINNKYFKKYTRDILINKYMIGIFKNTKNCEILSDLPLFRTFNFLNKNNIFTNNNLKILYVKELNNYIKKAMQDEIISLIHKQFIFYEQSKYEEQYVKTLMILFENIYNKKIILDIVNLKNSYNSNNIFTNILLNKLKIEFKRKNMSRLALDMFELITVNSILISEFHYKEIVTSNRDKIMHSIKNKFVKGMKITTRGRSLKKNTSTRSITQHLAKGSIRNIDSSDKGLSAVLLRGYAKSNTVCVKYGSRMRSGSFGLKTWISTT